ncbi:GerMN domain-containing protein [Clostridium sp. Marseille-P2415]|uniref:GerMN domain-containing protein n=1 Tax=Clostridium sp. Marseille-P2415 TaxID=1805471 RepID=UPI00098837D3|nr:GerMN domain-containing protein [Clostridium sp. Marseille-P2415]
MKRLSNALLLLVCLICLTGCERGPVRGTEATDSVYRIYYLNSAMTKMEPQDYTMPQKPEDDSAEVTDWEIRNLMEQLRTVPKDLDRQAAVPDKVGFERYKLEDTVLYLYFDNNYAMMNATREILCRASLVRTLTQIKGVDYVAIYTAEQPLMDSSGSPVGPMANTDFIDNISNVNSYEKTELVLYFADETGEKLVKETREVVHNVNTSLEKLVIEQLIAGPGRPGMNPTLPKDTKLLNVSVNENVCYINFDASFLNNTLEVKEYIPIYSIVNSLAAVSSINKVQITVGGSQEVMFRDSIPLNQLFERNLDYNAENEEAPEEIGGIEQ